MTRHCLLIVFFLICFIDTTYAQTSALLKADSLFFAGEQLYNLPNPTEASDRKAISLFQNAIRIYREANINTLNLANAYANIGAIYQDQGSANKAIAEYQRAIAIKKNINPLADSSYFKELVLIGNNFFYLHQQDSALNYYDLAEAIIKRYTTISHARRLYNSLGLAYYTLGNYQQSLNYYEKAILSLNPNERDYLRDKNNFKNNIATSYAKLGNYQEALDTYKEIGESAPQFPALTHNLGKIYAELEMYDSAIMYLNASAQTEVAVTKINALNNLGGVFLSINNADSAEMYFRHSLWENLEAYSASNSLLAEAHTGIAKSFVLRNQADSALSYYHKALSDVAPNFSPDSSRMSSNQLSQVASLQHFFRTLQGIAHTYRIKYSLDRELTDLQYSLQNYHHAIRTAHHIQKTYDNDEAKLFLVQTVYPVYEEAISVAYQLYAHSGKRQYAELAFQFSELSKASVLSEILREVEIKSSGGMSDSLIQEEKRQKQQIARVRLQMMESQDSSKITSLGQILNEHEISLARTVKSLQKDEKFYRLKYQQATLNIAHLQSQLLEEADALVEYFIGQDSLYSFLLTRDHFLIKTQPLDSFFYQAISDVQAQLYDYQMGEAYTQSEQAYTLYQKLVAPFEKEISDKERLIIVPDGQLNYIPFEMLNDDPASNHYLIFNHAFSYAYSASLLEEAISNRKAEESNQVLAMAPFAGDEEGNIRSNGFSLLFGSKAEVENIGGSIYLENQATKRLFLELVSSYGIIHLATHASIDNNDPLQSFIAFYPNQDESASGYRLYTQELYNLRLDSVKLVVLSACETGNGQLVRGEGIISLARAFAYAGCPNIITTLWKAQDRATATIASSIHQYLRQGHTKAQALRMAKIDYLESKEVHHLTKTPYYWANFIFIGDTVPIYKPSYAWFWWGLIGLLILVGLFWLAKKTILKSE
ncbi:CHAT domain-containing protein [Catalinimonas niigatensis]|uniref:CHAT domain-containing protein n=1 Tax=Catalinimonas niigatensis TaxID=1397264 RepID=UPI002666D1BB|nr:CHAT domain-containing protein [Catalinimonas niigatensis]WPP52316.1 CHAT domain-containing protein [Catalinimonas niigatensis]